MFKCYKCLTKGEQESLDKLEAAFGAEDECGEVGGSLADVPGYQEWAQQHASAGTTSASDAYDYSYVPQKSTYDVLQEKAVIHFEEIEVESPNRLRKGVIVC